MKQVAAKRKGAETLDAQLEAARDMMIAGGASMVYHFMSDGDVERIMRHPTSPLRPTARCSRRAKAHRIRAATATPSGSWGSTSATRRVLPIEEAIRKMTSLPAQHFRFQGRGLIREGQAADITVFDPAKVGDTATFENPHAFAAGVPHVLVNGVPVVRNGQHTGARPGQVLTAPGAR